MNLALRIDNNLLLALGLALSAICWSGCSDAASVTPVTPSESLITPQVTWSAIAEITAVDVPPSTGVIDQSPTVSATHIARATKPSMPADSPTPRAANTPSASPSPISSDADLISESTASTPTLVTAVQATPMATLVPITATTTPSLLAEPISGHDSTNAWNVGDLADRVGDIAIMLAEEASPRRSASDEEANAAEFLSDIFEEMGLDVYIQAFRVNELSPWGEITISVPEGDAQTFLFDASDGRQPRIYAAPMKPAFEGMASGEIVYAGLGREKDFAGLHLEGKIALIGRGELSFQQKQRLADEAGAAGVIIFNSAENAGYQYMQGMLDNRPTLPVVFIPWEYGEQLVAALESETGIEAIIHSAAPTEGYSGNVIAELRNDIDDDQVVIIGAHYDTTPYTQGANDNGSGVAAVMVLTEELSDDELPFDLRFILFGSEETGLHGSQHYVWSLNDEEEERIVAMINIDVVGAGDIVIFGQGKMDYRARDAARTAGVELKPTPHEAGMYASDHTPFIQAGHQDVMWIFADDLAYINSTLDTVEHIESQPMGEAVAVVLGVIERMADEMGSASD